MKNKSFFTLVMCVVVTGCTNFLDPDEKPDYSKRVIVKKIEYSPEVTIEWYYYSLITGSSRSSIDILYDSAHETVCRSSFVSDIAIVNDTLKITLWKNDYSLFKFENKFQIVVQVGSSGAPSTVLLNFLCYELNKTVRIWVQWKKSDNEVM